MTIGDLKLIIEKIDDEVSIVSPEGKEYTSVTLFIDTIGNVVFDLE